MTATNIAAMINISCVIIGILVGLFFVFAVWFLYKKAYQLQQVNHNEQTDQLVGRECVIYFKQSDSKYTDISIHVYICIYISEKDG